MKILAITQARVSSSRLPAKVLLPLGAQTVLDLHLKRLKKSKRITDILVATTQEPEVDKIVKIAERQGCLVYQGSLEDVLDRFYQGAKKLHPDVVVRVTSDCPLLSAEYVDDLIEKFLKQNVDYASNCLIPNLPDGMDAEVMTFNALEQAWYEAKLKSEREHVTSYIWKNSDVKGGEKFRALAVNYGLNLDAIRITLDRDEDYEVITKLVQELGEECSLTQIVEYLKVHPEVYNINANIMANEGYIKSLQKD